MTSAALQILAIMTMLIDHIGAYLLGPSQMWMRMIGRLAMPLFVFGIAEGFIHTSSRWKYFLRVLIFALIAEIPFFILHQQLSSSISHNIMFSLALSILALWCIDKKNLYLALVPLLIALPEVLQIEYGCSIVILAILFYLCRKYLAKKHKYLYYLLMPLSLFVTQVVFVAIHHSSVQLLAILAIIPLLFYNGKKGRRLPKYAGYIFYPAHLLIILWIRLLLF